jgi:glutamate synthase domain-containing protein 3
MTGGRVVILGATGRNFAAGMSGGIAYVWDPHNRFEPLCNPEMVDLDPLVYAPDIVELRTLIENHLRYTGSTVAAALLRNWDTTVRQFVKVMPTDYKRVLEQREAALSAGR